MKHHWQEGLWHGAIKVCNRCPDIWWVWHSPQEPTTACVPIEDAPIDYAAPQGEVA